MQMTTKDSIFEKCKAGYPALYVLSAEDIRIRREIKEVSEQLKRKIFFWDMATGLVEEDSKPRPISGTESPIDLLTSLEKQPAESLFVLRDFHHHLENPLVQALFKNLLPKFKLSRRTIILQSAVQTLPPEMEKNITLIESVLPDKERLGRVLDGIVTGTRLPPDKQPQGEVRKELIESATGLTTEEAENVFSLSLLRPKILKSSETWDPKVVLEEKCAALKKTGLLEYIPAQGVTLAAVGGMKELKQWVSRRKRAFTDEAKAFGLPAPKGILMVGPPGSGKSLGAKAVSAELGLPLIRCDFGKMFGSLVGQSEANMRKAIEGAEAMSPSVLWIDEIEKALAGTQGGAHDSGIGARLLGYLLTWMQEKTSPVFVYATANDVTGLPPELLRKGRFDEMWSVLLPDEEERREILQIHLTKRNRAHLFQGGGKKAVVDIPHLAKELAGFSGAEIESIIIESLFAAFDAGRDVTQQDLVNSIKSTKPLSETMREKIVALEEWCENRTRPASGRKVSIEEIIQAGGTRHVDA